MEDWQDTTTNPKRGSRRSTTRASTTVPDVANDTRATPVYGQSDANQQSQGFVDRVRERASVQLNSQKDRATDGIGSAVHAVRQSTQQLRDEQHDTVAQYIEQAADQLDRFATRMKQKSVNELLDDAQRLARRQPALFIGGAFALGLLGARFFKSSSPNRDARGAHSGGYYGGADVRRSYEGGSIGTTGTISGTPRDMPGTESF